MALSTLIQHPENCDKAKPRTTSNIPGRDKSSEGGRKQKRVQNIPKMVIAPLFLISTYTNQRLAVYVNNHTGVWGSWYDTATGSWGYACCHSTLHLSYCAGLAGIEAAEASSAQTLLNTTLEPPPPAAQIDKTASESREARTEKIDQNYSKKRIGEGDVKLDQDRLAQAVSDEKKRKARGGKDDEDRSSKKVKSSLESGSHEVTEEELGTHHPFDLIDFSFADEYF